jgi:hypothetical protein
VKFLVHVICVSEADEHREQVFEMEREHLTMETLGLGLEESKALLRTVQEFVLASKSPQILNDGVPVRIAANGTSKAQGSIKVKTVFGPAEVLNSRWHRCPCQSTGPSTFRGR